MKTSGGREVRVGRPTCWWTEVACSRHRVTWAGPEEGWAGPCSLPWPPPPGHPNSMRCTVQWCPMLWTQVLNTNRSLGCRFWPLSPNGLGFTGPLEERGATLAAVRFLGWWNKRANTPHREKWALWEARLPLRSHQGRLPMAKSWVTHPGPPRLSPGC